nr:uncharacterized mitochondrial protein AtMg00810-like [Tanacetum cinerariifolium]
MSSIRTPQQNGVVERQNRTLVEAARTIKPDISFLHVFGALCYPKNDREDTGKLGANSDIDFFIGYSADSCAYRIYNRRTKKTIETMNVSFDELSAMAFEQRSSKPGLQTMYDDYISGQPSATTRTVMPAQEPQVRQTSTAYTSITDTAPTPTDSSSHATNIPISSQDVDELNSNAMVNGNTFVNPFANSSTSAAESSSSHNVYVDDIIFGSTRPRYIQLFSDLMKSCFEMSMMGEMTFFLGLQVNQSPCGIFINLSTYVLEILMKYGMESCDPVGTPMEIKDKLDLDQNGTPIDATQYRSMIGALMYLTSSRPDIVHATCLCARYQAKPTEKHLKEVKRIFRYLRGTLNTGLWYTKDSGFELTEFLDADYTGCKDTFKSTSGGS